MSGYLFEIVTGGSAWAIGIAMSADECDAFFDLAILDLAAEPPGLIRVIEYLKGRVDRVEVFGDFHAAPIPR